MRHCPSTFATHWALDRKTLTQRSTCARDNGLARSILTHMTVHLEPATPRERRKGLFHVPPPPLLPGFPVTDVDDYTPSQVVLADHFVFVGWPASAAKPLFQDTAYYAEKVCIFPSSELLLDVWHDTDSVRRTFQLPRVEHSPECTRCLSLCPELEKNLDIHRHERRAGAQVDVRCGLHKDIWHTRINTNSSRCNHIK